MSAESDLKKDGIEVISKLDTLKVNSIAMNISSKICEAFPHFGYNQNELFIKLSRLNMYIANMPEGMAEANYFYKNSSIYFNSHICLDDVEEFAIHECIHYIQEVKDKHNYLLKMGLCDYTEFKIYGMGLNEAAVQLMSSKIIGIAKDFVKYYGISFETISPSYYPVECCLVSQLAYIIGENLLFESTLKSNDNFKDKCIELLSYKSFMAIQNNIDKILFAEEEIIKLNNKIMQIDDRNKKIDNMIQKIDNLKKYISTTFFKTQNLILTSYFDKQISNISSIEEIDCFKKKLCDFRNFIGTTDGYTFFDDYYLNKICELEYKHNIFANNNFKSSIYLQVIKENKITAFFKALRKLLFRKSTNNEYENY